MCDEAYITASTSNERQWVQRRGRILRKSKGKEFATIHDFVITKTSDSGIFQGLIKNEMKRVDEFFRSCANKEDIKSKIDKIKLTYNLE
jgi:superfamily II DNA or RNA helicase